VTATWDGSVKRVYVDRGAREQQALHAEAAEREVHARRQAELLGRPPS